jgi:hypothetical protein
MHAQVVYAYTHGRHQIRGFSGTTAGDPLRLHWEPDVSPSHSLIGLVQATPIARLPRLIALGTFSVTSGFRYTPLVDADINGDGMANDRAFVFDPATTSGATQSGMQQVLASASRRARACLERNMGRVAAPNSCHTPPSTTVDLQLAYVPPNDRDWPIVWSLKVSNLLAAVDRGLHGSNGVRGWGQPHIPDPVLLHVTGFDQTSHAFTYAVNSRFGDVRPARVPNLTPFTIVLEARVGLTRSRLSQLGRGILNSMAYRERQEPRGTTPEWLTQLMARNGEGMTYPNPIRPLLDDADSLSLSTAQIAQLEQLSDQVDAAIQRALSPIVDSVMSARARGDARSIGLTLPRVTPLVQQATAPLLRQVRAILTPLQYELLPQFVALRLKQTK